LTAAAFVFVISLSLFTRRNGINHRQASVGTFRANNRTRYLLGGNRTAHGDVATFRFDLLL